MSTEWASGGCGGDGELALLEGWLALQQDRRDEAIPHLERARQELGKKNPEDYWLLRQVGELLGSSAG